MRSPGAAGLLAMALLTCTHIAGAIYTCIEDAPAVLTQQQLKALRLEQEKSDRTNKKLLDAWSATLHDRNPPTKP
jgi:hypothetical protein